MVLLKDIRIDVGAPTFSLLASTSHVQNIYLTLPLIVEHKEFWELVALDGEAKIHLLTVQGLDYLVCFLL